MSLLADFGDFIKTPEGQGLLSGVFGYAANAQRGTPINNLGRGGVAGLLGYANAQDRLTQQAELDQTRQVRQYQIDDYKRKQEQQAAQQKWLESLNPEAQATQAALSGGGGPTVANAAKIQPLTQANQVMWEAAKNGVIPASDYIKSMLPDNEAYTLGEGQVRYKGNRVVAQGPAKTVEQTPAVREYEFAKSQGYTGSFVQFQLDQKRAGASRSTVNVGAPETEYNKVVGKGLGEQNLTTVEVARNAPEVVRNAQAIRTAIQNGAITGTGAEYRQALEKALATVGLVGPDAAANTEALVAALGKTTLAAIKTSGLGAGNGFTDKDRAFLEQAASGQITATKENLLRVADLSERIARSNHGKGVAILQSWSGNPALKNFAGNTVIDPLPEARPEQSVVRRTAPLLPGYKQPLPTTSPKFLGFE